MINDIFEVAFTDPRQGLLPVQEEPGRAWDMVAERCKDSGLAMAAEVQTPEMLVAD